MREVPQQAEDRAEEQLRDCDGVAARRIDDGDAELGGRREIDVIGSYARAPNDAQFFRLAEDFGGELCRASSDECVVVANALQQLRTRQGWQLVNMEGRLGKQDTQSLRVYFVGDEEPKLRWG